MSSQIVTQPERKSDAAEWEGCRCPRSMALQGRSRSVNPALKGPRSVRPESCQARSENQTETPAVRSDCLMVAVSLVRLLICLRYNVNGIEL